MVDQQLIVIAGSVAGAVTVGITIIGGLYNVFSSDMSTTGALALALMGAVIYALLVMSIHNHVQINSIEGDES